MGRCPTNWLMDFLKDEVQLRIVTEESHLRDLMEVH
jgi:hypothetical protein